MRFDFSTYLSPFTWRYGSAEMRQIFSEESKYRLWRKIWLALAQAQHKAGLVTNKELQDLKKHEENIDIERILQLEKETKHDVVAAIKEFAEKTKIGGGKIHLGATSMDITDNADVSRIKQGLELIDKRLTACLGSFVPLIKKYAHFPCIGYTHLQPAEPTTLGYRFALYAQDLLDDASMIRIIEANFLRGKGLKGAVGTAASYVALLQGKKISPEALEKEVMDNLGIKVYLVTGQVYPRKLDYLLLSALAGITQSLHKFAFDLRLMQSPSIGEWMESFGKRQVGSSAMPFKRNPINSEKICSLARYVVQLSRIAWDNAAASLLERTLDDSASRRIILPEGFLAADEILTTAERLVSGLVVNQQRIKYNLSQYGPFAATEAILMETVKNGANRQQMHEVLGKISMQAWGEIHKGKPNPMEKLLVDDYQLRRYLPKDKVRKLLDVSTHIGNAPQRALALAKQIVRAQSS